MNHKYTNIQNWPGLARQARYNAVAMARLLGISTRQLRRLTTKHFGRSTRVWLNEQWSLVAVEMLAESDSAKWVACELGMSESGFSHRFKRRFGCSPTEFLTQRQQIRARQAPPTNPSQATPRSFESQNVRSRQQMSA
jgi:AraC-like DNA-binding protein